MTDSETRVLARTAVVLLVVSVARFGWELRRGAPVVAEIRDDLPALLDASRRLEEENDRRGRPLSPGELIDPNRASDVEIDRLPGVGPATARAIVEARERAGGFRRPEDLLRVRGIGAATLERMLPHVDLTRDPPAGLSGTARRAAPRPSRVSLNRSEAEELERLPGVGPALARRIVELRTTRGGFRSPEELLDVRGIGPATLERLRPLVRLELP